MASTRKRSRTSSGDGSSCNGMRRTISLSELAPPPQAARASSAAPGRAETGVGAGPGLSARNRRHSLNCLPVTEAAFLKVCGYCHCDLGPGYDTFIYLGEVAFCSQECRQHQMNLDEYMETNCFPPAGRGGGSGQSSKGSTIAAA